MSSGKIAIIAGVAVLTVGGVALGIVAWRSHKQPNDKRYASPSANKTMRVSTSWGTPMAASGVKDSLGLTVYPEMYEEGRLDRQDACAWEGCIGEIDASGRCTGCPQM